MRTPDVRQTILEIVLELLADSRRRRRPHHHRQRAAPAHDRGGDEAHGRATKIFDAYYPDRYYNHDAEDPDGMVELGSAPTHGEVVEHQPARRRERPASST